MNMQKTIRLTTAQAAIAFLKNQYVERDGRETAFFAGAWGIFGHGNVAGIGQALRQDAGLPYYLCRNEQAMTHTAIAYAKMKNRLQTFVCTTSIGPGATNMVTGAACATINRIPLLLLPGDIFARRNVGPVLQQLESENSQDISVNDVFKPVSRYWDRINRPDQLPIALLEAMRVLTSPSQTGTVTLAMPQDVRPRPGTIPQRSSTSACGPFLAPAPIASCLNARSSGSAPRKRRLSSRAAVCIMRKLTRRSRVSPSRRASRWVRPRQVRVRSTSIILSSSAPWA